MTTEKKRTLLGILFVATLFGPLIYLRQSDSADKSATSATDDEEDLLSRYGFRLEEAAQQSGLEFRHTPPRVDERLKHIEPQIASMGASASIVDYDNDGWSDLYVTNSSPGSQNRLFRNQRDGTFVDVAEAVGVADLNQQGTGACMGSVWADYDNDGDEDLFVYKWGRPELFRNESGESFVNVTQSANLPEWINAGTATWFDYDRDGHVDLFIAGYWPEETRPGWSR